MWLLLIYELVVVISFVGYLGYIAFFENPNSLIITIIIVLVWYISFMIFICLPLLFELGYDYIISFKKHYK